MLEDVEDARADEPGEEADHADVRHEVGRLIRHQPARLARRDVQAEEKSDADHQAKGRNRQRQVDAERVQDVCQVGICHRRSMPQVRARLRAKAVLLGGVARNGIQVRLDERRAGALREQQLGAVVREHDPAVEQHRHCAR